MTAAEHPTRKLVAWQRSYPDGRWSLNHLTDNGARTLCGRRIPSTSEVHVYGIEGDRDCARCEISEALAQYQK